VDWKYLSPDDTILGATFFTDGAWPIWPNGTYQKGDMCDYAPYRAGSIVINQRLLDSKKKNARQYENYVVCHECAHWIKDQEYFRSHFADNIFHLCQKNDFEKTGWRKTLSELEIIERQANYLAAAILMPRDAITKEFFRIGRYRNIPNQPIEYTNYVRGWVAKLAKKYDLNFNPVLYRLRDLNIIWLP
jgi:Zn-dependent peptidase ImmA (M78 family)